MNQSLPAWQNFYVIVGSSAGALIGLQFIVLTLMVAMPVARTDVQASRAFATPSVVHLGVVLLLSAVACVPWSGIAGLTVVWGAIAFCGLAYVAIVARRMRVQTIYKPVFEDWLFHVLLPFASYAILAVSAFAAFSQPRPTLFFVGGAALLLLFIGIHNAWDTITYHVFVRSRG